MPENPVNHLVIFYKQLGDMVLLEPALAKLATHTTAPVQVATNAAFDPLLSLMTHVIPAPRTLWRRADHLLSFHPGRKAGLVALTTRAATKRLIVTREKLIRPWHGFVYRQGCVAVDESTQYRARYFFDLIPDNDAFPFRPPQLHPPPVAWLPAGLPEEYILVHATSAWKRKSWPVSAWARLLDQLHEEGLGPVVVTGGKEAWEQAYVAEMAEMADKTTAPLINLCGRTPLTAYLALAAKARLVLCIDGSAHHLAAAFGRPTVTLFGPTHPLHWHHPSPRATLLDARSYCPEAKPAVEHIPVEHVLAATRNQWLAGRE